MAENKTLFGTTISDLDLVIQRYIRSERYTRIYFDRAKTNYKTYKCVKDKVVPWRNNIFVPMAATICDSRAATAVQHTLSVKPFVAFEPRESGDARIAKQIEKVVDSLLSRREVEMEFEWGNFCLLFYLYGKGYISCIPKFKNKNGKAEYAYPDIKTVDFWDVYPDPSARKLSMAKYLIIKEWDYIDNIKKMEQIGIYKNTSEVTPDNLNNSEHIQALKDAGLSPEDTVCDPKTGRTMILHYWEDGNVISVAGLRVIIRNTKEQKEPPLPYNLPITDSGMISPLEFYPRGLVEKNVELNREVNIIRSQRRDWMELEVNKPALVDINAFDEDSMDNIVFAAGNLIPTTNTQNGINFVNVQPLTAEAYKEDELVIKDMQDVSGEYEYSRGVTPSRKETATGIMRLQQASRSGRFALEVNALNQALVEIAYKVMLQVRRFMPKEKYERLLGEQDAGFYNISIDDLKEQYDLIPMGSSVSAIKEVRAEQRLKAWDMISKIPPQVGQQDPAEPFVISYYGLVKSILEDMEIKNVDDILISMKKQQQQQMQGQESQEESPVQKLMKVLNPEQRERLMSEIQRRMNPQPQEAPVDIAASEEGGMA